MAKSVASVATNSDKIALMVMQCTRVVVKYPEVFMLLSFHVQLRTHMHERQLHFIA